LSIQSGASSFWFTIAIALAAFTDIGHGCVRNQIITDLISLL
jgi:hypothetical protein